LATPLGIQFAEANYHLTCRAIAWRIIVGWINLSFLLSDSIKRCHPSQRVLLAEAAEGPMQAALGQVLQRVQVLCPMGDRTRLSPLRVGMFRGIFPWSAGHQRLGKHLATAPFPGRLGVHDHSFAARGVFRSASHFLAEQALAGSLLSQDFPLVQVGGLLSAILFALKVVRSRVPKFSIRISGVTKSSSRRAFRRRCSKADVFISAERHSQTTVHTSA
jgi:hypothetical protein